MRLLASVQNYERKVHEYFGMATRSGLTGSNGTTPTTTSSSKSLIPSSNLVEIWYEDYIKNRTEVIKQLCIDLQVLPNCNGKLNINLQYQRRGKNRNKRLEEIWPQSILDSLVQILQNDPITPKYNKTTNGITL